MTEGNLLDALEQPEQLRNIIPSHQSPSFAPFLIVAQRQPLDPQPPPRLALERSIQRLDVVAVRALDAVEEGPRGNLAKLARGEGEGFERC